ncbi:MAG: arginase family protein [Bacteroidota bacterium]|nr:arginase family protein [Bacteroidota bacterium]
MKHLRIYNKQDVLSVTAIRRFETRLGERIQVAANASNLEDAIKTSSAKFVLVGVPEDIGVKANGGIGGADSAWLSFLQAFLNVQSNDFLDGNEILLIGHFDFSDIEQLIEKNAHDPEEKLQAFRHAVNTIDDEVEQLVHIITQNKKLPLVIGGGHNNAYPCIKGAAKGWHKAGVLEIAQINAINLDAHANYLPEEGRHAGNAFRYAEEDGYLEKYCVIGLQENYITQNTWVDMVNNPFIDCITFEDIFLHEKRNFIQAISHATAFTDDTLVGIELDLDAIQNVLSNAITPVGITTTNARQYLNYVAMDSRPAYLHICEGAIQLSNGKKDDSTGKLIAFLVCDFIKAILSQLE